MTENIENPRLWRMGLHITDDKLTAVSMSMVTDGSLEQRTMPLDSQLDLHHALEEAVYAAPFLLNDFGKVDIVMRTSAFTLLPPLLDEDSRSAAAALAHIADDIDQVFFDQACGATVAWALDSRVAGFLARTFRNAPVRCHISPLLDYFSRNCDSGNSGKLYVHLADGAEQADFIAFAPGGRLLCAASHTCAGDNDVLYHIMNTASVAGFDLRASDEVLLCGDNAARMRLLPLLRRYVAHALPLIFPSAAIKAGIEAFKAPFPLIILPLCE